MRICTSSQRELHVYWPYPPLSPVVRTAASASRKPPDRLACKSWRAGSGAGVSTFGMCRQALACLVWAAVASLAAASGVNVEEIPVLGIPEGGRLQELPGRGVLMPLQERTIINITLQAATLRVRAAACKQAGRSRGGTRP